MWRTIARAPTASSSRLRAGFWNQAQAWSYKGIYLRNHDLGFGDVYSGLWVVCCLLGHGGVGEVDFWEFKLLCLKPPAPQRGQCHERRDAGLQCRPHWVQLLRPLPGFGVRATSPVAGCLAAGGSRYSSVLSEFCCTILGSQRGAWTWMRMRPRDPTQGSPSAALQVGHTPLRLSHARSRAAWMRPRS